MKVTASSHIVRARFQVEVEGTPEEINSVWATVMEAVRDQFPDSPIEVTPNVSEQTTQPVVVPSGAATQDIDSQGRKAA